MALRLVPAFAGRIVALALLALMAITPPARAQVLPEATSAVSCYTSVGVITDSQLCSTHTDLAQVTLLPFAGTHAEAIYPGSFDVAGAAAAASLTYNWAATGGTPGELLHIDVGVNLLVFGQGPGAQAFAAIFVTTAPNGTVEACVSIDGICGANSTSGFFGHLALTVRSGDVNTLQLLSTAGGSFGEHVNGGWASADPMISFDPAFALNGEYQIVLSPGVANAVGPVPEPSAWAMLALGLAGVAALRRHAIQA